MDERVEERAEVVPSPGWRVTQLCFCADKRDLCQGSCLEIVRLVEADVMMVEIVKMPKAGVEAESRGWSLLAIYNGWVVLYKWDRTEHLLAKDGIHAYPVEIVRPYLHVR